MSTEQVKKERGNVLSRYLKGAFEELRKVSWPSKEETWRKAWIVIWFSVIFSLFLGALDYLLNQLVDIIL